MGKPSKTDNGNNSLAKKDMTGDSSAMKGYMERDFFHLVTSLGQRSIRSSLEKLNPHSIEFKAKREYLSGVGSSEAFEDGAGSSKRGGGEEIHDTTATTKTGRGTCTKNEGISIKHRCL